MPAVAAGAAIWGGMSLAAGVTGFAAVAAVGAVAAGIGAVTGNKDLTKLGTVLGVVGGIGSLAASTGVEVAAADGIGETSVASSVMEAPAADAAIGATPAAADGVVANVAPDVTPGILNSAAAAPVAPPTSLVPNPNVTESLLNPSAVTDGAAGFKGGMSFYTGAATDAATTSSGFFDGMKKYITPVSEWMDKNKMLSYTAMQMIGGGLSYLDPLRAAQVQVLEQQTALNQQRIAAINGVAPTPTSTSTRGNVYSGNTPTFRQPNIQTGLINSGSK